MLFTEAAPRELSYATEGCDPSILFSFESIVIVGASDDQSRIGGSTLFLLKKYGYRGQIYGLNPKYAVVQGIPCFAEAEDLPESVDVAVFCVSAQAVRNLLPRLQKKGLKGAVIYSAGFGESGNEGRALQEWLRDFALLHNIVILGPNCVGQVSFIQGRSMTFTSSLIENAPVLPGRIALLSQSGGVATNIMADSIFCGVRFSHMITTGNEANLGLSDYLRYFARDDMTDVVLGYIEGLKDGDAFCKAAADMQRAGKPVIMMRVGASEAGQDAVSSHTGQISSDDTGYQAAFDRYGVIRARTLQELNDYARVFSLPGIKPGVTVVTTSGGAGVYVADLCAELEIELSRLSASTEHTLSQIVPSYGRVRNPVDLTAQVVNDMSILERSMKILLDDANTGVLLFLLSGKGTREASQAIIELFTKLQAETKKKIVICWLGVNEAVRTRGSDAGLIIYQDPARFLTPLRSYLKFYAERSSASNIKSTPDLPASDEHTDISTLLISTDASSNNLTLPERASMECLTHVGVDQPKRGYVRHSNELIQIGKEVGYPCVMKIVEPIIAHKSDSGGVILNIKTAEQLQQAWNHMQSTLGAKEVMVAEQIEKGVEVLVGCLRDETFGLRLTIGSGGIWTNFIRDTITIIPPFTEAEIRRQLPRLAIWAPLTGARGQQPMAVDALVNTILGVARLGMATRRQLREFECNPVIVTHDRAVVVDAIGFS